MARPRQHSKGPADESNRHLAVTMASMPRTPQDMRPKADTFPWGVVGMAATVVAAIAWVAFWTLLR